MHEPFNASKVNEIVTNLVKSFIHNSNDIEVVHHSRYGHLIKPIVNFHAPAHEGSDVVTFTAQNKSYGVYITYSDNKTLNRVTISPTSLKADSRAVHFNTLLLETLDIIHDREDRISKNSTMGVMENGVMRTTPIDTIVSVLSNFVKQKSSAKLTEGLRDVQMLFEMNNPSIDPLYSTINTLHRNGNL
jgi:hypothetical protein